MTITAYHSTISGKLYGFQIQDANGRYAHQATIGGTWGWTDVRDLGNLFASEADASAAIATGEVR